MDPPSPPKGARGRPRKYHTEEERKAAKLESQRRKLHEMRENEPDRYKELMRQKNNRDNDKFRKARELVAEAEAVGGARLQDPDVVAAQAYLDHIRAKRRAHFKDYYNTHPEFRERHREKVAAYDRAKYAAKKAQKAQTVAA